MLTLFLHHGRESIQPSGYADISGTDFLQYFRLLRFYPLAGRCRLPVLVCWFHLTLQERRFIVDDNVEKAVFRVQKTSYYNKNGLFIEEFQICMNGRDSIMCQREEFEDLYKIMGIALNDRKEETNGRGSRI